jgi:carbon-monoxide dehydrogenase medium subunit
MVGRPTSSELIETIAREAWASVSPIGDIHASPEYRRDLIATAVKRALTEAAA